MPAKHDKLVSNEFAYEQTSLNISFISCNSTLFILAQYLLIWLDRNTFFLCEARSCAHKIQTFIELFTNIIYFCPTVSNILKYFVTGCSGHPNISEYMYVGVLDGIEVVYCDASKKILEPRQDWVKKLFDDKPDILEWFTQDCFEVRVILYTSLISDLNQHLNQSGGTVFSLILSYHHRYI